MSKSFIPNKTLIRCSWPKLTHYQAMSRFRPVWVAIFLVLSFSAASPLVTQANAEGMSQVAPAKPILGTPIIGNWVTCPTGAWLPSNVSKRYSYQWIRNGVTGPAQSNSSLLLGKGDVGRLSCVVTAWSTLGSAVGLVTPPITVAPIVFKTLTPTTLNAEPYGGVLSKLWINDGVECMPATWSHRPERMRTLEWLRDGKVVPAFEIYNIEPGDVGHRISCRETVAFNGYVGKSTSKAVLVPRRVIKVLKRPGVGGWPVVNDTMSCWGWQFSELELRVTFAWLRDGRLIPNSGYSTFTAKQSDLGKKIACRVMTSAGSTKITTTSDAVKIRQRP
jgi:hypothetical protein